MPKRWDRSKYPPDWEDTSRSFRESRDYTCEQCGVRQGMLRISKAGNEYTARTAAAHKWPNDTHNPAPDLLCLCEICHMRYDHQFTEILEEGEHQAHLHEVLVEWEYCDVCEEYRPPSHFPHEPDYS